MLDPHTIFAETLLDYFRKKKTMKLLFLLLFVICTDACPLWFNLDSTGVCQCGDDLGGVVTCSKDTGKVSLQFYFCMTYNELLNQTVVGPCILLCPRDGTESCQSSNELQSNSTQQVNEEMCREMNREGQLCSSCKEGYGLSVYSYSIVCVNCSSSNLMQNISKFIAFTFIPLTVFYLIVIIFKISVTSGNMIAYVLACQLVTVPALLRVITKDHNKFLMSWFTIWNLDVFRSLYSPFCIHPKMTALHVLALDYLVGVYPIFLIFITYFLVILHDRYPIVVKLWRPGYRFFAFLRREWDIRGSLVQTFASFLILSYVKILYISFDVLTPVKLKNSYGQGLDKTYLFINADMEFFGSQHLPYAILAIVMLTIFNILPMILLLLYPCHCFQTCLSKCGLNSLVLSAFMDAFQGCYRKHCRHFAAIYLLVRVIFLLTISLVKYPVCIVLYGFYSAMLSSIIVFFEPYQVKWHNKIDIAFFQMLVTFAFLGVSYVYLRSVEPQLKVPIKTIFSNIIGIIMTIVILYGTITVLKKIVPKKLCIYTKKTFQLISRRAKGVQQPEERFLYRFEGNENSPLLIK